MVVEATLLLPANIACLANVEAVLIVPDKCEAAANAEEHRLTGGLLKMAELHAEVVPVLSETGGGSLPGQSLESRAVALKSARLSAEDLSERFRGNEPPIFGRITRDVFLLDMRTVDPRETNGIVGCVQTLM